MKLVCLVPGHGAGPPLPISAAQRHLNRGHILNRSHIKSLLRIFPNPFISDVLVLIIWLIGNQRNPNVKRKLFLGKQMLTDDFKNRYWTRSE